MVVYIDVLLCVNTIINYVVLMTVEKLLKRDVRLYRMLLGAFTGALFSLIIFLDINSQTLLMLLRVISSVVISFITFGFIRRAEYIKAVLLTVTVSLVYCGAMILVYQLFRPANILIINDVVYIEVPPLLLIALTAVIYLFILLIHRLFRERIRTSVVSMSFTLSGREYACIGKIDTGCNLKEPFSGAPVIIVSERILTIDESTGCRVIPYTTVNGSSYLKGVKADKVLIDKKPVETDVYIACANIQNGNYDAVINSEIIR